MVVENNIRFYKYRNVESIIFLKGRFNHEIAYCHGSSTNQCNVHTAASGYHVIKSSLGVKVVGIT